MVRHFLGMLFDKRQPKHLTPISLLGIFFKEIIALFLKTAKRETHNIRSFSSKVENREIISSLSVS